MGRGLIIFPHPSYCTCTVRDIYVKFQIDEANLIIQHAAYFNRGNHA
jgi:hypothetical protein